MPNSHAKKILVTTALPYANAALHLGHMFEHFQADYWVRFQKMIGNDCLFLCGDDTHGTAVMLSAKAKNISPVKWIESIWAERVRIFKQSQISFDHYGTTHCEENREICESMYNELNSKGHITTRDIEQTFCEHDKMFLPDRFIKGTCPKCKTADQYGDSCEVCGSAYSPADLIEPKCSLCGSTPIKKNSGHIFFELNHFREMLQTWLPGHTQREVEQKVLEWFSDELRPWDISRDEPYFGFKIPGTENKFFYVWVDAPIGYMAFTKQWCSKHGRNYEEYWKNKDLTEVYHFIGKDIVNFHTLFWPSFLHGSGYRLPTAVWAHGFLTVNGQKMSKSKGTQITAEDYLSKLDPTYLRYYYATKMNASLDDFDLNAQDFSGKVNGELIGKIVNLGSRSIQLLEKQFASELKALEGSEKTYFETWVKGADLVAEFLQSRETSKAMGQIRDMATEVNRFFDEQAPWKLLKTNPTAAARTLSLAVWTFRSLALMLHPVCPTVTERARGILGESGPILWSDIQQSGKTQKMNPFVSLLERMDPLMAEELFRAKPPETISSSSTKDSTAHSVSPTSPLPEKPEKTAGQGASSMAPMITVDDFAKVDLRVAEIVDSWLVEGADKLVGLKVSLGAELGERQIFAGIRAAYAPEKLKGRKVLVVANLAPRKMKFGVSEGMVLAAGDGGADLFVFSPDSGAKPGARAK